MKVCCSFQSRDLYAPLDRGLVSVARYQAANAPDERGSPER